LVTRRKQKSPRRLEAEKHDQIGIEHYNAGRYAETEIAWRAAAAADPGWDEPPFSLGVLYKWQGRWSEALASSRHALALNPQNQGALWNTGIAATALRDWQAARAAWTGYGIELPPGEGEIRAFAITTPIRLDADSGEEVVWTRRIDPARAVITSVPLPESGRRHGDIVLHDGEPKGERMLGERTVAVFNMLGLWRASREITFRCRVYAHGAHDSAVLERMLGRAGCASEDMSNIRMLCRQCSEGLVHEQHDHDRPDPRWNPNRRLLIATRSPKRLRLALKQWARREATREVVSLRQDLPRLPRQVARRLPVKK